MWNNGEVDGIQMGCSEAISAMLLEVIYDFARRMLGEICLYRLTCFKLMVAVVRLAWRCVRTIFECSGEGGRNLQFMFTHMPDDLIVEEETCREIPT